MKMDDNKYEEKVDNNQVINSADNDELKDYELGDVELEKVSGGKHIDLIIKR